MVKNLFKKMVAGLLVMTMLISFMPAFTFDVFAADETPEPVYILAGGDFQEAGDHTNSTNNVANILAQISRKYTTMDGALFVGDYDCETHNDANETATGIAALMGEVQNKYSNLNYDNTVLVQGNHDYKDGNIDATGGHDFNGYAVYVLNEDDYPNGGGSQANIQTLANNLKTWLNNKIGEGYSAPVFIVSHLPLAFTPRTVTQGDAKYAKYIFDVLNDAGANGLNIIFLHGHDHAFGPDNYMGGEAIYLPKGDNICIAEAGSTSKWTEETLNFCYMNAGYTGYYSDGTYNTTAGTEKLTMTVFAITGTEVTVERYSANGLYNLKSAGRDGSYSDTSVTNVSLDLPKYSTVYTSPQTITLGKNELAGEATIGQWIGIEAATIDDVTATSNGWVQITAPSTGTVYRLTNSLDAGKKYVIVNRNTVGTGNAVNLNGSSINSTGVTVKSDDNGIYIEVPSTTAQWTYTNNSRFQNVNTTNSYLRGRKSTGTLRVGDTGDSYITWNYDTTYGLYGNNTSYNLDNSFSMEKRSDVNRVYIYVEESQPATNGTYYEIKGELSYTVSSTTTAEEAMAMVKAGIDGYSYKAMSKPSSDVTGTKVEDGELKWEWADAYQMGVPGDYAIKISYTYDGVDYELGTAEIIVPAATTYYAAEGNGLYLVDMNTTADNAMAAVKAGITVYSADNAEGTGKIAISDDVVTWNWVDTYNGADSGPYTVELLKDGTSLGTVEVKVNIKYTTGINGWTYIGETEATGGTHTYTLDTDGIDYGEENKYIIVDDDQPIVLNAQNSSDGTAHSITISGNTATVDTRDYEYHFIQTSFNGERYELITKGDGSQYLYQQDSGVRYGTRDSVKFQVNHHGNGVYDIHDIDGTNWYIIYNNGWTVTESTSARVRLYKYTGTTGGTPAGSVYALIEGKTIYTVDQGTSAAAAMAAVKAGITGYINSTESDEGRTELDDSALTWKWKNTYAGMVTGSYWVEISYNGKVLGTVEVKVKPAAINNYPEYPDEGAVKVNKTATGIDFQASGIAQVELSASGVPSKKGVDVIIMLDTSSSMTTHTVTGTTKTRAKVLEESLVNLITKFKTPGADGELMDIKVAIADFNGFYGEGHTTGGTAYDRDAADMMSDDISYTADSEAQVYTGDGTLGAGAFVSVEDLAASYTLNYTSGTNYDYAMDAIYQMGTAIKEANGSEDRDLYVIFMSDGAAMQWNYYHSQGASSLWNNWITGAWDADDLTAANLNCTEHAYYYDEVDHNGDGMRNEHRMANAIKGDPSHTYEVIRKTNTLGIATGETNMYMVPGLGAQMFAISYDAQADNNVTEASMDKSIESLATAQTGTTKYYYKVTSADELDAAFDVIGMHIAYAAENARFVDQMGGSFNLQMKTATYDILVGETITTKTLAPVIEIGTYPIYTRQDFEDKKCTESQIGDRIGSFTLAEVVMFSEDGTKAYSNLIDVDKDGIYGVAVNSDGTYTISDSDDNILGTDGVIYAKTFLYNNGRNAVAIDGVNIPTKVNTDGTTTGSTNVLPKETFYWKLGTVQTTELAMRYYVYLDGSMEGTREAGSYATNNYAILYYDNYLDNSCKLDTISPSLAWKSANISYAFYLVNEEGKIIVNQATGETGSFANKIAVTNPVLFDEVLLNNDGTVKSLNVASLDDGVLPKYYTLYDIREDGKAGAEYKVDINSNSTGGWTITSVKDVATTYVTGFSGTVQYSNEKNVSETGYDYTHTTVWFAVIWTVEAHPDSVVVDFGLPVDVHVLSNDMFGANGELAGIGAMENMPEGYDTATVGGTMLATGFGTTYKGTYGDATADLKTGVVRYTLNTMQVDGYDQFGYAVNCKDTDNPGYYYDTVTVIPATSIYYEDDFAQTRSYTWSGGWVEVDKNNSAWTWSRVGTAVNATQDEDRPGKYSLSDANNIYGYDSVNLGMSTYSMGSALKATVDYDNYAVAEFSFYGTGFDVVSMTNSTTGTIVVKVVDVATSKTVNNIIVDTYYGYKTELHYVTYTYTNGEWVRTVGEKAADGTAESKVDTTVDGNEGDTKTGVEYVWVLDPNADDSIYQVPVIKLANLAYGHYKVEITVMYDTAFDHVAPSYETGSYDFYLDAVRIYDPANDGAADGTDDTTIEDAYKLDGEGWPSYFELRNMVIDSGTLGNDATKTEITGIVFIDGDAEVGDAQLSDYINYGPNNEIYLAPGQRVAFILKYPTNVDQVHIGIKAADGNKATYTITNVARQDIPDTQVKAGDYYAAKTFTMDTATEMYYNLTDWIKKANKSTESDIIVISNTGNREENNTTGIISLTNIKFTYTSNPGATDTVSGDNNSGGSTYRLSKTPATYSAMSTVDESTVSDGTEATVSNEGSVYMTAYDAALTLRSLNTMYREVFEPEQMEAEISRDKVKEGDKVNVTVKTSDDVEYIIVNGNTVTRYRYNRRTGERIWTVTLKAEVVGEMIIEVVACDSEGLESEPLVATVSVEAKTPKKDTIRSYLKNLFDRFFG